MSLTAIWLRDVQAGTKNGVHVQFGGKAAGLAVLQEVRPRCTIPYAIPDAVLVAARESIHGAPDSVGLTKALQRLTATLPPPTRWQRFTPSLLHSFTSRTPILIRSSDTVDEAPGKFDSPIVLYDPFAHHASIAKIVATAQQLQEQHATLGLVIMPMIGSASRRAGVGGVYGAGNVSFVADSHSPFSPAECFIASAIGLGTAVVEAGRQVVSVTARRTDGAITGFTNRTEEAIAKPEFYQDMVKDLGSFALKTVDGVRLRDGSIRTLPLRWGDVTGTYFAVKSGALSTFAEPGQHAAASAVSEMPIHQQVLSQEIGVSSFGASQQVTQLVAALHDIASAVGRPVQLEGAYASRTARELHLYQLLDMPATRLQPGLEFSPAVAAYDFSSRSVLGMGSYDGPLLVMGSVRNMAQYQCEDIAAWDARHAESGYAVYYARLPQARELQLTPHATVRLSRCPVNAASHAVTAIRRSMAARGHGLLATDLRLGSAERQQPMDYWVGVFPQVHLESNGTELRGVVLSQLNDL